MKYIRMSCFVIVLSLLSMVYGCKLLSFIPDIIPGPQETNVFNRIQPLDGNIGHTEHGRLIVWGDPAIKLIYDHENGGFPGYERFCISVAHGMSQWLADPHPLTGWPGREEMRWRWVDSVEVEILSYFDPWEAELENGSTNVEAHYVDTGEPCHKVGDRVKYIVYFEGGGRLEWTKSHVEDTVVPGYIYCWDDLGRGQHSATANSCYQYDDKWRMHIRPTYPCPRCDCPDWQ